MRNPIRCTIAALLLVWAGGFASAAHAAPVLWDLEMDQDPQVAGWSVHQGAGGGSHSVADGLLTINSPSYYELHAPSAVMRSLSNSAGWVLDTRFKFSGGNNDMTLWVWDNSELNRIDIGHNSIIVYPGAVGYDLVYPYNIGTGFHTYHLEAIGQQVRMTVDGQPAFDALHLGISTGSTPAVYFGDGWDSFSTVSVWDYVRISAPLPEPSAALTCALAATVGACLRRRRRLCLNGLILR